MDTSRLEEFLHRLSAKHECKHEDDPYNTYLGYHNAGLGNGWDIRGKCPKCSGTREIPAIPGAATALSILLNNKHNLNPYHLIQILRELGFHFVQISYISGTCGSYINISVGKHPNVSLSRSGQDDLSILAEIIDDIINTYPWSMS